MKRDKCQIVELVASYLAPIGVALFLLVQPLPGQTFSVIHDFTNGSDGGNPVTGLTVAGTDTFYGTARTGGSTNNGLVFKLSHRGSGWVLVPIYTFQGGMDGANPFAAAAIGPDGRLYGTTENGGGGNCSGFGSGCGTIYALAPSANASGNALGSWTETVLYRFQGGYDGADPFGMLVFDRAGNAYGTTQIGGSSTQCLPAGTGCGTAYELSGAGDNWAKTILWSFGHGFDGVEPFNGLQFDTSGNLYGTTFVGGTDQDGTIFELSPSGSDWTESVLYSVTDGTDGGLPYTAVIFDSQGNLITPTSDGGSGAGGTVVQLTKSGNSWQFNLLYSLTNPAEAECGPFGTLLMGSAGNLYGTTRCDGANRLGSVFELSPTQDGWVYSTLHDFSGSDGQNPYSSLVIDSDGNLFGTTLLGGQYGQGVVFEITP
jgi:uncharacterized repeat protein (TIGR03803 family)